MRPTDRRPLASRALPLLALALAAGAASGQEFSGPLARPGATIRDGAKLFDDKAVAKATEQLERLERDQGVPTVIETVESLGSHTLDELAQIEQDRLSPSGLFDLIPRRERKIIVRVPQELRDD